jgi:hypothetical protein
MHGDKEWPLQAGFRLVVRLDYPVKKSCLVGKGILKKSTKGGFPRGSQGKLLDKENVVKIVRLLWQHNPSQKKVIVETFLGRK